MFLQKRFYIFMGLLLFYFSASAMLVNRCARAPRMLSQSMTRLMPRIMGHRIITAKKHDKASAHETKEVKDLSAQMHALSLQSALGQRIKQKTALVAQRVTLCSTETENINQSLLHGKPLHVTLTSITPIKSLNQSLNPSLDRQDEIFDGSLTYKHVQSMVDQPREYTEIIAQHIAPLAGPLKHGAALADLFVSLSLHEAQVAKSHATFTKVSHTLWSDIFRSKLHAKLHGIKGIKNSDFLWLRDAGVNDHLRNIDDVKSFMLKHHRGARAIDSNRYILKYDHHPLNRKAFLPAGVSALFECPIDELRPMHDKFKMRQSSASGTLHTVYNTTRESSGLLRWLLDGPLSVLPTALSGMPKVFDTPEVNTSPLLLNLRLMQQTLENYGLGDHWDAIKPEIINAYVYLPAFMQVSISHEIVRQNRIYRCYAYGEDARDRSIEQVLEEMHEGERPGSAIGCTQVRIPLDPEIFENPNSNVIFNIAAWGDQDTVTEGLKAIDAITDELAQLARLQISE